MKIRKWHTPTGFCKYCGQWVGYTPKDVCEKYPGSVTAGGDTETDAVAK